ncbi:MAG: permease [Candidatus Glassbacteria bacterium]
MAENILMEIWAFTHEVAFYLLAGFLLAGLVRVFVHERLLVKYLSGGGLRPVFYAALLGTPLPLCSCGVLPVAASLRKSGASRPATTSFLISTPESGVDSIAISWAMLDPLLTIARPIGALATALFTGWAQLLFNREEDPPAGTNTPIDRPPQNNRTSLTLRLMEGLRYSFLVLLADIAWYIAWGLVLAGIISYFLPAEMLQSLPGGRWAQIGVVVALCVPLYICATSSTPLAAALIAKGLSPGVALLFLLVGPATNISSLTVIWKILGPRSTLIYLAGIIGMGLVCCFGLDALYGVFQVDPKVSVAATVETIPGWVEMPAAVILILLLAYGIYKEKIRPLLRRFSS